MCFFLISFLWLSFRKADWPDLPSLYCLQYSPVSAPPGQQNTKLPAWQSEKHEILDKNYAQSSSQERFQYLHKGCCQQWLMKTSQELRMLSRSLFCLCLCLCLSKVSQKSLKSLSKVSQKSLKSLSKVSASTSVYYCRWNQKWPDSITHWLTEWQGQLKNSRIRRDITTKSNLIMKFHHPTPPSPITLASFTHVPTHQYDRKMCLVVEMLFFPHCDTHLCTLCDLRPGNFLIVYLPSSFCIFFTFIFYPPLCQIDFCSHYETRGLQQIMTWWKKCAENVHTAKGNCRLSSSIFGLCK